MEKSCGKSCRKILSKNLVGNSCGTRRRGKRLFKTGSDRWKFSIWNRVMGSQPIRIQLGKILQEIIMGNSCGKFLQENLVGKSCGKISRENLVGNCCRKILWEIVAGKSWILVGNSCEKILQEIILWEILWEILAENLWDKDCGKIGFLQPKFFAGNSLQACGKRNLAGKSCDKEEGKKFI